MTIERSITLDGTGCVRRSDRFSAENAGHADLLTLARRLVFLAQAITQLRQQRVMRRVGKVINVDLMRVALAPRGPH